MIIHAVANVAVVRTLLVENVGKRLGNIFGVGAIVRVFAMGQEGEHAEAHDTGFATVASFPCSILELTIGEIAQTLLIHRFHLR